MSLTCPTASLFFRYFLSFIPFPFPPSFLPSTLPFLLSSTFCSHRQCFPPSSSPIPVFLPPPSLPCSLWPSLPPHTSRVRRCRNHNRGRTFKVSRSCGLGRFFTELGSLVGGSFWSCGNRGLCTLLRSRAKV